VVRVERERSGPAGASAEVAYFITSLDRGRADASRLLGLVRAHWHIGNRLRYVRGVSLGEDACRARAGSSPQALAALRNGVIHLLGVGAPSKAAAMRRFSAHPHEAIRLIST
jgi:predicted transposase YbfD/YdcC